MLSGTGVMFLSASVCLGLAETAAQFISAYPQFVKGTLHPIAYGSELIGLFILKAQTSPVEGYGILAAKLVALNMVPLPGATGGRLLIEVCCRKRGESIVAKALNILGTAIALPVFVCWAFAFVSFLRHHH